MSLCMYCQDFEAAAKQAGQKVTLRYQVLTTLLYKKKLHCHLFCLALFCICYPLVLLFGQHLFFWLKQEGYDHSYYFISTFIDEHVQYHAQRLFARV